MKFKEPELAAMAKFISTMAGLDVFLCSIITTMLGPKNQAGCMDLLLRQNYSTKLRHVRNLARQLHEQHPAAAKQAKLVLDTVRAAEKLGEKRNALAHAIVRSYDVPHAVLFNLRPEGQQLIENLTAEQLFRDQLEASGMHESLLMATYQLLDATGMLPPWIEERKKALDAKSAELPGTSDSIRPTTARQEPAGNPQPVETVGPAADDRSAS